MAALAGAVTALGLVGCAAVDGRKEPDAQPARPSVPAVPDPGSLRLPVDRYLLDDRQLILRAKAGQRFLSRCMRGFGVDFPEHLTSQPARPRAAHVERRYGLADLRRAERTGYDLDDRATPPKPSATLTSDQLTVLGGSAKGAAHRTVKTFRGKSLPEGGCAGELSRLFRDAHVDNKLLQRIDLAGFSSISRDARVKNAHAAWSACMKRRGFSYAEPLEPAKRFIGAGTSPGEVATATADVTCKQATNTVGIAHSVDVETQTAMINQNLGRLEETGEIKKAQLEIIDRILAR
ncbi:hypothetical protein AB0I81_33230 [Nonomuraea sp. NPDC050404]|uniref:hypothetical protein n=1 Tax=Nonomuraea sp. NPDC050404 TaxID=3155783 RepID=UPI0033D40B94